MIAAASYSLPISSCRPSDASAKKMSQTSTNFITERGQFLVAVIVILAMASPAAAQRDPLRLTHGPMLGNPTAHSMAVWGRTSDPGQFTVRYGTQAGRLDQISPPAVTTIDHDNTGVAQ